MEFSQNFIHDRYSARRLSESKFPKAWEHIKKHMIKTWNDI